MNLNQLKYFQAVCNCKSVSKASEIMHVSQPSLSSAIKELENEFGVLLFRRQHKGMSLTAEGETLFNLSQNLLLRAEETQRIMLDLGNGRKVLRLGVPPMIGSIVLPIIYGEFATKHPSIEIEITEAGTSQLYEHLEENRIDMVLIPHVEPFGNDIKSVMISELEIVCCTHSKNRLAGKKRVCTQDLKDEKLVLFKDSFFQTEQIKKWFFDSGVKPNIALQTDQLSTLVNMVSSGTATGFMFKKLIDENSKIKTLSMDVPLLVQISLIWREGKNVYAPMKAFTEFMKSVNF